jgi:hypothetical protein
VKIGRLQPFFEVEITTARAELMVERMQYGVGLLADITVLAETP